MKMKEPCSSECWIMVAERDLCWERSFKGCGKAEEGLLRSAWKYYGKANRENGVWTGLWYRSVIGANDYE